jgi:signal transduction histidine kinase/type II secretory pathway pseudopilin PulG
MPLKTKITLVMVLLVLAVVGVTSLLYLQTLTQQVIRQADARANLVTQQVFLQAQNALRDAAGQGQAPVSSQPGDVGEYVRKALDQNTALTSLMDAEVGYSFLVYEVTIVDLDDNVLISSPSLPDRKAPVRPPLSQLVNAGFLRQLRVLYGPPQAYEVAYPFKLGAPGQQVPFGEIRVAAQTGLLATEITPALRSAGWLALGSVLASMILAILVSNTALAPLERISAQLDRISQGEFDQAPLERRDEFGQVSTKISAIGQQLRGVREIFSTLRENLDQVLGGLEDGLLLFTRDGHAVMVSPSVQNFLGVPADRLLGRLAGDIFPEGHPLRSVLGLAGDEFAPVAAAEVDLSSEEPGLPPRRFGVSVQGITEGGTRMGALVTLRDLDSLERISRQLQVSERLAALGRVTAGVAHEVKNPLNSMRLWLENLKECLPAGEEMPRQAVAVLDSEIDRLDSVVKRFLDFMRTPEMRLEETQIEDLLREIAEVARPQLDRAGVQVETSYADLPPLNVDRALIKQALLNLVLNAIEAMPQGGKLTLALERRGDQAEIRVTDTGKGIPPEQRTRVFQLFFTTRPGGSGIGLASAYRAVQLHDGEIDFDSEVGRGTTFRIDLPLAHALEPAFARPRSAAGALSGKS